MKNLLNKFRTELSQTVLDFLWAAWSQVGVMGGAAPSIPCIVDPEPMLLQTWACARQDPRVFDEALDWLVQNGRWINVGRLTTLMKEDQVCPPSLVGAMAAFMSQHDKTPKWKTLAHRCQPKKDTVAQPLFLRQGKPLSSKGDERDETFFGYGWLRSPVRPRNQSQPLPSWTPAGLLLKSRAFFGVSIRADVYAYLMVNGPCTASRLAREMGYSQRRVQDALVDMQMGNAFQIRQDGNRKEYFIPAQKGWHLLFEVPPKTIRWFNWRAFGCGISKILKATQDMKVEGLSSYIFASEFSKWMEEARGDFASAGIVLPVRMESRQLDGILRKQLF
ncbi:MAG: hypothetical protein ACOYMV_12295 [Verrucomicrobiia bacterium]